MSHIIILDSIETLQGENITGTGIFSELLGYLPTVETCEHIKLANRTPEQQAVIDQSEVIAEIFENGFTPESLAVETTSLGNLIAQL